MVQHLRCIQPNQHICEQARAQLDIFSEHFNPIDATRYVEECVVNRSISRYYRKEHIFI